MAKRNDALANLFANIADAARVVIISNAMRGYKDDSIIDPSPLEYILANILGVDPMWVSYFDSVYRGKLDGMMLVGAEDHPGAVLGQAMMVQRHGFIQHPLMNRPAPIHPKAKAKIDLFIHGNVDGHTHTEKGWHGSCPKCLKDNPLVTAEQSAEWSRNLKNNEEESKEREEAFRLRSAWKPKEK